VTACKTAITTPGDPMDYLIGGVATILLFAYLVYALLRPEKF
jgi:K+-transporting ATPase KdpF subunit